MASALHTKLGLGEVHIPFQWQYADEDARLAATGFTADDLHKLALQEDSHTLWLLHAYTPAPLWVNIGTGTSGLVSHVAIFKLDGSLGYDTGNLEYFWDDHKLLVGVDGDVHDWEGRIGIYGSYDAYLPNSLIGEGVTQMPGANGSSSRGTGTEPIVLQAGDLIARMGASLYTGSTPSYRRAGSIRWAAEGVSANLGCMMKFRTKQDGVDEPVEAMRVNALQRLLIGQTADTGEKVQVTGNVLVTGNLAVTGTTPADSTAIHKATSGEIAALTAKTTPVAADLLVIEDSADSNNKKKVTASSLGSALTPIFGANYQYEASEGDSTTTSDQFQDKVTLTTPALTGTYFVQAQAGLQQSTASSDNEAQLINTTDAEVLATELWRPSNSSNRTTFHALAQVTFTGAAKTFKIQYRSVNGAATSTIRRARIVFWRVG